jgi:predicted Zn-dependent protease
MLQLFRVAARGLTYPARAAWRRPRLAVVMVAGTLAAAVLAALACAHYEWQAAHTALAADRPREALSRITLCLYVWPWDPEVHLLAARAARLSGDLAGAEAHLNRCLKLQGEATQAVQLEFLLHRAQAGELDDVAGTLIDCVENGHEESPVILETLSRAYMLRLRYRPAYACLTRWIELRPDAAKAYHWRGWVLERMNQAKSATEDYQHALKLDPDLMLVRLRVAEMLVEDKRLPEALPYLEELYRQAPDHPQVQARLGMCRFLQNRPEEARRLMEAAVVHLPKDPVLLIHLARLDVQAGKGADAEKWLRSVLTRDPSDTEALYTLSSALQLQGRTEEAVATLKQYKHYKERLDRANKLLREVADSPTATAADYAEVGSLLLNTGQERLGVYWLEQALERDPTHQPAHKVLAEYYEKKEDHETAAAHRRWLREPDEKKDPQTAGSPDKESK